MYENSMNIIFDRICMRLNKRKEEMNINSKDLLPGNPNLSSAILHNRKDPKKNPYLIPDTQISSIMESLKFESIKELLFGTDKEIESYAYDLFCALITDTIKLDKSDKLIVKKIYGKKYDYDISNRLESVLTDYVPYALKSIHNENQLFADFAFQGKFSEIADRNTDDIRDEAIKRLYENEEVKYPFIDLLKNNVTQRDAVVKLDKAFLDFVMMHLLPLLISETSDDMYSLGHRVYNSLTGLINPWESYLSNNYDSRFILTEREQYQMDVINGLITAEIDHAYNLYNLQKEISLR